jgi:hypothetical protein
MEAIIDQLIKSGNDAHFIEKLSAKHRILYQSADTKVREALYEYKMSSSNLHLALTSDKPLSPSARRLQQNLDLLLDSAGEVGQWMHVCHGVGIPLPFGSLNKGDIIDQLMKSYISTTLFEHCDVSCSFAQETILHIIVPPECKGFYIGSVEDLLLRDADPEYELLLQRGIKLRVITTVPNDSKMCQYRTINHIYALAFT